MRERRRHVRYEIATRVDVRLAHPRHWVPAFKGNTVDVSREGLGVSLYQGEGMTKLTQSLLSEDQSVEVALDLPVTGERITGKGMIKWFDIGSVGALGRDIRAGIFLEQMNDEDRARWAHFVEGRAGKAPQESVTG